MPRVPPAVITQRNDRANNAGCGGKQGAGDQGGHRHGTGNESQANLKAEKQAIEDIGPLNDVAHKQEERYGYEHIVVHHAKGVLREEIKNAVVPEGLAGIEVCVETKADAHCHQGEGNGKAQKDDNNE
ncbi:MAG: hypothetical protein RI968_951 [Pseudomonadota bacterium]